MKKAHDVFNQVQEQLRLAQIQTNMGMAHYRLEQWESAETFFIESIKIFELIGNVERVANGMDALGLTLIQQGRWEEAVQILETGIEKLATLDYHDSYAPLLGELQEHRQEAIDGKQAEDATN